MPKGTEKKVRDRTDRVRSDESKDKAKVARALKRDGVLLAEKELAKQTAHDLLGRAGPCPKASPVSAKDRVKKRTGPKPVTSGAPPTLRHAVDPPCRPRQSCC
jgi:hypothetical protein